MKEVANRPRDIDDAQPLKWILDEKEPMSEGWDDIHWSATTWEAVAEPR